MPAPPNRGAGGSSKDAPWVEIIEQPSSKSTRYVTFNSSIINIQFWVLFLANDKSYLGQSWFQLSSVEVKQQRCLARKSWVIFSLGTIWQYFCSSFTRISDFQVLFENKLTNRTHYNIDLYLSVCLTPRTQNFTERSFGLCNPVKVSNWENNIEKPRLDSIDLELLGLETLKKRASNMRNPLNLVFADDFQIFFFTGMQTPFCCSCCVICVILFLFVTFSGNGFKPQRFCCHIVISIMKFMVAPRSDELVIFAAANQCWLAAGKVTSFDLM